MNVHRQLCSSFLHPTLVPTAKLFEIMTTLLRFHMSVAPRMAGPIAPPLELCLDLGIIPEARVAPQESAECPCDSNDSAETPTIAGNEARAAPHEPAERPCYNTAHGLQLCFLFFFHVSPFPPHVACHPRA